MKPLGILNTDINVSISNNGIHSTLLKSWVIACAGTTNFRVEMHIAETIGSEIARLVVMICAQNMYQMKANDL